MSTIMTSTNPRANSARHVRGAVAHLGAAHLERADPGLDGNHPAEAAVVLLDDAVAASA